jgi:CBS domain-containing protein
MITVGQVLQAKGYDIWTITPDAPVYDALELMADKEVGALLVLSGEKPVGIISERDYARKVVLKGKRSIDTSVKEIMVTEVIAVRPEQPIEECMALMTEKRIRHLPVCADDCLVGIVSIGDVVKAIISEQEFMIEQLERYIDGVWC